MTNVSFAVVNLFTESGNVGAPHLVESPQVDVINYTGSTKVGREIARQAAGTLKRVCLELDGGGCKQSGVGTARGARPMEEFQELKTRSEMIAPR
jgi:acyl-CoA reductase-like NAD-dependent aldehyde dehydrogenase